MGKRGEVLRPCYKCGCTVNFVFWPYMSEIKKKKIYHWQNQDGTHHRCQSNDDQMKFINKNNNLNMKQLRLIANDQ